MVACFIRSHLILICALLVQHQIALATIKYRMLNQDPIKDIVFVLKDWTAKTGDTGQKKQFVLFTVCSYICIQVLIFAMPMPELKLSLPKLANQKMATLTSPYSIAITIVRFFMLLTVSGALLRSQLMNIGRITCASICTSFLKTLILGTNIGAKPFANRPIH